MLSFKMYESTIIHIFFFFFLTCCFTVFSRSNALGWWMYIPGLVLWWIHNMKLLFCSYKSCILNYGNWSIPSFQHNFVASISPESQQVLTRCGVHILEEHILANEFLSGALCEFCLQNQPTDYGRWLSLLNIKEHTALLFFSSPIRLLIGHYFLEPTHERENGLSVEWNQISME